jgi:hypothetical protein
LFWYHRQTVLGWWKPSGRVRSQGRGWTGIWTYVFKPLLKRYYARKFKNQSWQARYGEELKRLTRMNYFPDLEN